MTLNLAGARIVLGGNFTVAGSLPTAGTITSLTYSTVSGTPVNEFAVTGLSMSYGSFMDAMADNDFNTVVGNGADWISGSTGNDKHYGGAGNDRLEGLAGNDSLFGGAGNDTLFGGAGNDSLQGGNGNDIYVVDSILDRVVESAGGGVDGVRTGLSAYTLGANIENLQFTGVANFTGTGNGLNNLAVGSRGNDSLVGLDGNDTLRGGNGHDTLIGGNGNDFLVGDVGHGTVTTSVSGISPSRPNLPMTLSMTMAETSLNNSTTVTGFINNNTQNTPKFNLAFVLDVSGSMATPFGGATVGDINANGYANERLDAAIASFNALVNAFSDRVDGDFGANILSGGGGNDRLNGSYGDDTLIGGTGDDYLDGGEGWDSVSYAHLTAGVKVNLGTGVVVTTTEGTDTLSGVEAITGGSGNDVIGWAGSESNGYYFVNFRLDGGAGKDTLTGSSYSDILVGGAGDDVLDGGESLSSFNYFYSDYVDYSNAGAAVVVNLNSGTASGGAGNDKLINIEGVIGSAYADQITGGARQGDCLAGGGGADTLDGGINSYANLFVFSNISDSTLLAMDVIRNFKSTDSFAIDKIDLNAIDANTLDSYADSSFNFVGTGAFTKTAGQLRYANSDGNTFVYGDVDGNGVADIAIKLLGTHTLTMDHFSL